MDSPTPEITWLDRVIADPKVRATYTSLLGHLTVFLLLAMLAVASRPTTTAPIRIAMALSDARDEEPVEIGGLGEPGSRTDVAPDPSPSGAAAAEAAPVILANPVNPEEVAASIPMTSRTAEIITMISSGLDTLSAPTSSTAPSNLPADGPAQADSRQQAPRNVLFAARGTEGRSRGTAERGGSAASEAAVERGLEWLARHQAVDGSWRFDLTGCGCDGACSHPGTVTSTTASTGIAVLPFLGAGHTHMDGGHRETVTRALYYLMSRMRATPRGGDLAEGTMYGHGVATLALAEAFGMTGDPMLAPYLRDAVRFIETSQDLHGGGWRYLPGQAGDTTVTAWQVAALKSAGLAGVAVPSPTIDAACRFLDRVQVRKGEAYGYLAPQDRSCTSAIGLLCRIYTAWPEQAVIDRGLARLAAAGPVPEAVYQNFYLAQALLLRNHPAWRRWNMRNRDQLVARQSRSGHEAGSWIFADSDTAPGGRLGHTALAVLTLEVYYRLLPIYGDRAANTGW